MKGARKSETVVITGASAGLPTQRPGNGKKIDTGDFQVQSGATVRLSKLPTSVKPFYDSKEQYQELLDQQKERLNSLQELLYAHNRYSVLLIFQAMDAAGKDGAIKHVMSGINPLGCEVFSFKRPSAEELQHDFLWRTVCRLPQRGRIGIFNRSYYEEVLIVRVHSEILAAQGLPDELIDAKAIWRGRYRSIRNLEEHLYNNGTRIIKIFLHLSKDEQRRRFLERIDDANKQWKFGQNDIDERKLWKEYMAAYEKCINATSSKFAPWYVVPADDKKNARLIISQVILDTVKELKMQYPVATETRLKELQKIRKQLAKSE